MSIISRRKITRQVKANPVHMLFSWKLTREEVKRSMAAIPCVIAYQTVV
jgi:hypothetical protein